MAGFSIASGTTQERLKLVADGLVVAVAVSLPWSTSATAIFAVLWLFALIPTLHWADLRRELATPAGGLPVLLVVLGIVGMLWADVTLLERWKGLDSFSNCLQFLSCLPSFASPITVNGYLPAIFCHALRC